MSKKEQKEKEPLVVEKRMGMRQGPKPVHKPLNYPNPNKVDTSKIRREYKELTGRIDKNKNYSKVKSRPGWQLKNAASNLTKSAAPGIIDRASRLIPPLDYKKQLESVRERTLKRLAPKTVTKRPADKA